jgi:class 3 adenylate cyclase
VGQPCPKCGTELPPDARFCPACGEQLESQPPLEERKFVTVLFADLVGSTNLGEQLDAERLKDVMELYFEAMREEIERFGGTVQKFIGDAVMGTFGAPVAHEDDPERALRAARAMIGRLTEVNGELTGPYGIELAIRIGVNTGEVVAINAPRADETMVADAVNVAARLEQAANAGQVLVGERTARAGRGFRFEELEPLSVRGREAPVRCFVLVGETEEPRRGIPGLRAPLVGRERELALLDAVWERVVSERRPHLVTIYGDPGVGKSRLVAELAERLRPGDGSAGAQIMRGRCIPYGDGITYWPLAEILKHHAGVRDDESQAAALAKIRASAVDLLSAAPDPARAVAALAYTVGVEDPDVAFRDLGPRQVSLETHVAWRLFFTALAQRAPTVVVIEDIH